MAEAPDRDVVRDGELTEILHRMQDRREALVDGAAWSVAGHWRSFKADFVHATNARGDVAVKFGDGWTAADAHFVSSEVERVRTLFEQLPGGKVRVPRALGWSDVPAAVALGYVDGDMLFSSISERGHRLWNRGQAGVLEIMASCGQALGAYHSAEPATGDPAITKVALGDLLSAARRAGVRRTTILALEPRLRRARGYRFSPNDFIIDAQGRLVMLDPPHVRKYDYLQHDVQRVHLRVASRTDRRAPHAAHASERAAARRPAGRVPRRLRDNGTFLARYGARRVDDPSLRGVSNHRLRIRIAAPAFVRQGAPRAGMGSPGTAEIGAATSFVRARKWVAQPVGQQFGRC